MAGSVNKVVLIGNLGNDPDIRTMQSGDKVANLSIATSDTWKDKNTGERKERTQWHRVVIFASGIVSITEQYLKKGDKVYIEGTLENRSWEDNGVKKYVTEVVLRPYRSSLQMLTTRGGGGVPQNENTDGYNSQPSNAPMEHNYTPEAMDDEIPF